MMEHIGTPESVQFGGKLAEQKPRVAKSDSRYWLDKLEHPACTRDGSRVEGAGWVVRMMYQGRREYFSLDTANKAAAAKKSAGIWTCLRANGWESTLARLKPTPEKQHRVATVGEFLTAVQATAGLKPKTFADYARALRLIAASIAEIPAEKGRFGPGGGAREKWLEKVHDVPLSAFTGEAVQRWRLSFLAQAGPHPRQQQARKRSVNSLVLQAKSLFSARRLKFVDLILPNPLPFSGVEREKEGSYRYVSRFDIRTIIAAAQKELAHDRREEFKMFLLAIGAGLRRNEIDKLEWSAFDFASSTIFIAPTEFLSPKSSDSVGEARLDPEISALFCGYHAQASSRFVIESNVPARTGTSYTVYRCAQHFDALTEWLRSKGVSDRKPLHALRKEFGSLINEKYGIHAASQSLRHSEIGITARHYVDNRRKVTPGLGGWLATENAS